MSDDPWQSWQAFGNAARSYFENLKGAAQGAATQGGAAQQFGDFLREQFSQFIPWQIAGARPAWPPAAAVFGAPGASTPPSEVPAFGPTREQQRRAQRAMQAWQRMEAAQRSLQRLWQDVLREASTAFMAQVGASPIALGSQEGLRALYDRWIDCAEQAYARAAHSEAFCQAQAQFVNAASEWRREQQDGVEQWMKQLDLPTRSELNSLTRRLCELEAQRPAAPLAAGRAKRTPRAARSGGSRSGRGRKKP